MKIFKRCFIDRKHLTNKIRNAYNIVSINNIADDTKKTWQNNNSLLGKNRITNISLVLESGELVKE